MFNRLATIVICLGLLTSSINCNNDNNTPQPRLTVLSQPSSPTPIESPSPSPSPKPLSNQATNNFPPQEVIKAFCEADFKGVRTNSATSDQITPYILWQEELSAEAIIVSDFKIVNSAQSDDEANIAVAYTKIGKLLADEKETKIENIADTTETIIYKLVNQDGSWKIQYPQSAPHISMDVAKKLVKINK